MIWASPILTALCFSTAWFAVALSTWRIGLRNSKNIEINPDAMFEISISELMKARAFLVHDRAKFLMLCGWGLQPANA